MSQQGLPLSGQRVLVTRPARQADALCQSLKGKGAEPVRFPTLEIEPAEDYMDSLEIIKQAFMELDRYHAVIFVSANAARFAHEWIDRYWPQLPIKIHWLAVGEATARTLQKLDIPASCPESGMDSETLLTLPELQQIEGKSILICRGVEGREHLGQILVSRGAKLDYVELYRRVSPNYTEQDIESIIYKFLPSVMLVTSQQSLENLDNLCKGQKDSLPIHQLRQIPLIVPSQRIAHKAQQLGYNRVDIALNATDQSMIEAFQHTLQLTTADDEHGKIHER